MKFGLLNAGMLWGLAAIAIPLLIHLWNKRRRQVVDWAAMMFLTGEMGSPTRHRVQITEWLLLATRMGLLATFALALARPFWSLAGSETTFRI